MSGPLPVSHKLLAYYGTLWRNQATNDQQYLAADLQNHLYTPVVTFNDPLYDATDYGALGSASQSSNIGWVSQGIVNEPDCITLKWQQGCHLESVDAVDVCTYNDGATQPFGMSGDLWVHSQVKNCSSVITDVMKYVANE